MRPSLFGIEAAWKPKRARGVTQIWLEGTSPSTSVQADRQSPSIITRSPVERTLAKVSIYLPNWPPRSSTIRMVAAADVTPHENMATQSNRSQIRIIVPPTLLTPLSASAGEKKAECSYDIRGPRHHTNWS